MATKLKVGVLGAGYWGPKLVRNFHDIPDAEMAVVCDLRPDRLQHIAQLYPSVVTTACFDEMLASDVDAVAIATPILSHYSLARKALLAGKHVLVEKPLTSSSAEAEDLVELARAQQLVLMVGHTFEYNPAVELLRQLVSEGVLGKLYYINATRVNLGIFQPDVDVVWDLAPHDVSILLYVLGMRPLTVSARGAAYVQPKIHDVAYLTLNFPNEVLADIRVSWLDPCKIRSITLVGSQKMIVYDDVEPVEKIRLYDKGVEVPPYSDTPEQFRLSYRYGDVSAPPLPNVEPLRVQCEHFLGCIRDGTTPRSDGLDGLEVVRILEAASRSLLNGGMKERVQL